MAASSFSLPWAPAWLGAQESARLQGPPNDLLRSTFTSPETPLLSRGDWRPYPKAGEHGWRSVPSEVQAVILERAGAVLASPWPAMLATDELEFVRNGNRTRFEAISFGRRTRLGDLVLAECLTNTGRYLDAIANGVWLICEESFWGVPAHLGAQKAGVGLADESEPIIELFSAETAAILSWTTYLLEAQLNTVSPRIGERVLYETRRRILEPYFRRDDFSWMGLSGPRTAQVRQAHPLNNWNPWINSNVLVANLLLEREATRREAMVAKICRSVDAFLADYSPDAGCVEGPGYWARSAASFYDCCATLVSAHAGKGSVVLTHPFTRAMGQYIADVHIAGDDYVNFGDAHLHDAPPPDLVYRFGRDTGNAQLTRFGAFEARVRGTLAAGPALREVVVANRGGVASLSRALATVLTAAELAAAPSEDALPRDAWYPALGLMTARERARSTDGFYLAAQAAGNGRSHGHNDSGSFMIFHDGSPVFIDVGPEAYTATTFSKDRYTLWTMQSAYHNLPTIAGSMEHEGEPYRASNLRYETSDTAASFRADLASAYSLSAGVLSWIRTLTLDRARSVISITEDFTLGHLAEVSLSLMTAFEPRIQSGSIVVGDVALHFDAARLTPSVERIALTDELLKQSWGEVIFRLKLSSTGSVQKQVWRLEVRRTSASSV